MQGGRVFVPMRAIFEAMGAKVEFNQEVRAVIATKGLMKVRLDISGGMLFNNFTIKQTVANPVNVDGTIFVPLRTVAEAVFAKVEWLDGSVYITTNKTGYEEYPGVPSFGGLYGYDEQKEVVNEAKLNFGPKLSTKAAQIVHFYPVSAEKKEVISDYKTVLEKCGYVFATTKKENDSYNTTVDYYYNKAEGTYVSIHQVGTNNYVVGICITVPGSLESFGLEATN
jgi:hypothetical protein